MKETAQAVDVGAGIEATRILGELGRQEAGGGRFRISLDERETCPEDPDTPRGIEHQFRRFQGTVDDPEVMGRPQSPRRLSNHVDRLSQCQRPAVADDPREIAPLGVFEHEESSASIFTGVQQGDQVRVPQSAGGVESPSGLCRSRIAAVLRRDLEDHDPASMTIVGLENEARFVEPFQDPVRPGQDVGIGRRAGLQRIHRAVQPMPGKRDAAWTAGDGP
jgi:hypothetical protein